jgi:hypothetical protein
MSDFTYKNSTSHEGVLAATTETITFLPPILEFRLINDSSTDSIGFKFSPAESYRTLLPGENTILTNMHITEVIINSSASVAYRVWGLG